MSVIGIGNNVPVVKVKEVQEPGNKNGGSFGDVLKSALGEVNHLQKQSEQLSTQLALGQVKDLHQVTIASEKASLALQLTVQVRNKVMEAYQEIMRMQV